MKEERSKSAGELEGLGGITNLGQFRWKPEIAAIHLKKYRKPLSCRLHCRNLDSNKIDCRNNPDDIMTLQKAIFDSLGDALSIQSRTLVNVPFSCASFNKFFRSLKDTLPTDNKNVDFYLTGYELYVTKLCKWRQEVS